MSHGAGIVACYRFDDREWSGIGLVHRDLSDIEAIGVDEIQRQSGQKYLTLVYQFSGIKRLLWVSVDGQALERLPAGPAPRE